MSQIKKAQNIDENSLFKMVVEQSNFVIIKLNLFGKITYVSESINKALGYQSGDVIGRHFKNFIYLKKLPQALEAFKNIMAGKQVLSFETAIKKKDGSAAIMLLNSSLTQSGGTAKELVVLLQDISDLSIAKETAKKCENKFEMLANTIQDVFWISAPSSKKVIYISPAFEKIWQRKPEVVYKRFDALFDFIHPDDKERMKKNQKLLEQGYCNFEYRIVRPDGSVRWIRDKGYPIKDDDGKVINMVGAASDITKLKAAEIELLESEKRMRHIIEQGLNAVLNLNEKGKIVYASENVKNIIGYKSAAILGQLFLGLLPISEAKIFKPAFDGLKKNAPITDLEIKIKRKDGVINDILINSGQEVYENNQRLLTLYLQDITKRKKEELKTKESEERFRGAFENSATGMALVSISGRFTQVNKAFCGIVGFSEKELTKKTCSDLTPKEDLTIDKDLKNQMLIGKKNNFSGEKRYRHKNGSIVWTFASFSLVKEGSGTPKYFIVQIQDNTAKKIAENEIKISEKKYRGLFDSLRDGVVKVTMEGKIIECNSAYLSMLGYSLEELKKITYIKITPEKWHNFESDIIKNQVLAKGYSDPYDKEYVRKDGKIIPVNLRVWLEKDEEGQSTALWGIVRDISDIKKIESEKKESQQKFKELFEESPVGIELFDINGKLTEINESALDIFGVSDAKYVKGFDLFNDPSINKENLNLIKKGESCSYEAIFDFSQVKKNKLYPTKKIGIITIKVAITPITKGAKGYLAQITDITKDKDSEKKLKLKYEEIENMNKLMIGRELKMIELKEKIKKLEK